MSYAISLQYRNIRISLPDMQHSPAASAAWCTCHCPAPPTGPASWSSTRFEVFEVSSRPFQQLGRDRDSGRDSRFITVGSGPPQMPTFLYTLPMSYQSCTISCTILLILSLTVCVLWQSVLYWDMGRVMAACGHPLKASRPEPWIWVTTPPM